MCRCQQRRLGPGILLLLLAAQLGHDPLPAAPSASCSPRSLEAPRVMVSATLTQETDETEEWILVAGASGASEGHSPSGGDTAAHRGIGGRRTPTTTSAGAHAFSHSLTGQG